MKFFLNRISKPDQLEIAIVVSKIISKSPFFRPRTPVFGKPFKTLITNAGSWGWKSDVNSYGYVKKHPVTNNGWPKIPGKLVDVWKFYCKDHSLPNSCLINLYNYPDSVLGLHQDKDENDLSHPVLSISLGSSAIFKYGKKT